MRTVCFPASGRLLTVWAALLVGAAAADELAKPASWSAPSPTRMRDAVAQWLGARLRDAAVRAQFDQLWPAAQPLPAGVDPLDHIAATIAKFEPRAQALVALCQTGETPARPPQFELLTSKQTPSFARNHLRLYYARWLAQRALYDEAYELLRDVPPSDVLDPATLFFYQAVTCHRLLRKDECAAAVRKLLENERLVPRRYASVGRLMAADIQPLTPDSLDEVSRLMDDIRRRLQLSRAGRRVRQQEDDVIAKLDKMIEETEKQQQQMSAARQDSTQPSNPAQDSAPLGGRGPGNVDQKAIGKTAGWGNLPPKQREEALQQMSKDLPAHFRELIEEYFRKLARDGSK